MNPSIIKVVDLTKTFDDFVAVDCLNFTVHKNEIFGFLGPNGAGKTTTINMLTGLACPTRGDIYIDDTQYTPKRKNAQDVIGVVPDESNLYDELDGFENLCFCAALYGIRKNERERRAKNLLDQFNLTAAAKKLYKSYSKGMKRKLTLAAGIIHHPTVLFLDEPTTGIDVASARQIRSLVKELNETGTTIFMTTHYIEEAERLCHRIAFIVNGRIVKVGSIKELLADAQRDNIIQFTMDATLDIQFEADFRRHFQSCSIERIDNSVVRIQSSTARDLMPFMTFFNTRNIKVMEAKIIKPSLEEVFVKITGIERDEMRKEKEGKKK